MPIRVKKVGKKFRAVESSTGKIAKNRSGTAIDGGGSSSRQRVVRQVHAVNLSELRKSGKKGAPQFRKGRRR